MMIDRDLFIAARGFAGGFVDGEFEDNDLCARVKAMGRSVRIVPQAQLYHLEGQSRSAKQRDLALPYNAWLLKKRIKRVRD